VNRLRKPLLAVHLIASVGLLGAVAVVAALGVAGANGTDPVTVYPAMHLVETWLVAPLSVTALCTGVVLAVWLGWGLLRHRWVTIKLVVTATLTLLVFLLLEPRLAAAAAAALGQSAEPLPDATKTSMAIVPSAVLVLLVVNSCLGLFKPGSGRRTAPASLRGDPGGDVAGSLRPPKPKATVDR
jgi:hypothetical protein